MGGLGSGRARFNLSAVLKFAMAMENGRAGSEFKTARRARIRHAEWGKAGPCIAASTLASV
jgi:hypothetical protein